MAVACFGLWKAALEFDFSRGCRLWTIAGPKIKGLIANEATRRIKADASLRSIPIIAVTSYALSGEGQKARAAGCDDYVPKPFSPRQLLAKIRQYLQ